MPEEKTSFLWVVIPVVVVVLIGVVAVFTRGDNNSINQVDQGGTLDVTANFEDHATGSVDAPVTIVEYADFQCPACATYHSTLKQVREQFSDDQLRMVFRHFPLVQIHPNAIPAARASEAAHLQDKFWEMHDILFERQIEWSSGNNANSLFENYAEEIGLDVNKFVEDYKSKEVDNLVDEQLDSARKLGLNSTPTFLLNGKRIQPRSGEDFVGLILQEIGSKQTEGAVEVEAVDIAPVEIKTKSAE